MAAARGVLSWRVTKCLVVSVMMPSLLHTVIHSLHQQRKSRVLKRLVSDRNPDKRPQPGNHHRREQEGSLKQLSSKHNVGNHGHDDEHAAGNQQTNQPAWPMPSTVSPPSGWPRVFCWYSVCGPLSLMVHLLITPA